VLICKAISNRQEISGRYDSFSAVLGGLLAHAALSTFFRTLSAILAILASVARIRASACCGVTDNLILENYGQQELGEESQDSSRHHE
jgi:hypothetical protein